MRLRRKTHPLLASLRILRPDLRPRSAGFVFEVIFIVLCTLAPKIAIYPMFADMRRASGQPRVDDIAIAAFQNGQYSQSCGAYRRALPDLRHDYYGSLHAGEFLSYCGDTKGALRALTSFDGALFETQSLPRTSLAQVRLFDGRYAEAENLLGNAPSYPLYLAVVGQGRLADADRILESIDGKEKGGLAHVLLLRHKRAPAARWDAAVLCSEFLTHKPWMPSWLARVFESCILVGGADKLMEDPRFEPAVLALPGLRAELVQFTDREAPEFAAGLRAAVERIVARHNRRV